MVKSVTSLQNFSKSHPNNNIVLMFDKEIIYANHYEKQQGQLNKESNGLSYPYKKVIEINGTGVSTRFCSECLSHLVFTAKLNKFL